MRTALPFLFALVTALAWGLYGPTLGQARLADAAASPFRPYMGIGIAYLVLAILGGAVGMWFRGDSFSLAGNASLGWGFLAGLLGAVGAFGLTLSMFSGGARFPHAVMPVVFGGAVTVTAVATLLLSGGRLRGGPLLLARDRRDAGCPRCSSPRTRRTPPPGGETGGNTCPATRRLPA